MKARITKKGTLVVKGETKAERNALKAWDAAFTEGRVGFRAGKKKPIKRAAEDVKQGRTLPE